MPVPNVKRFLDDRGVRYRSLVHSPAYTAQETAALTHVKGQELAKTVLVELDGELAMAVVPASRFVDLDRLASAAGALVCELAGEHAFRGRFPPCEVGAMPPFGPLWGVPVFADESLTEDPVIAVNAGTHVELVQLAWSDFVRTCRPTVARFASDPVPA